MFNYVTTRRYPDGVSGRLKEAEARWYFQQLILAVDYLHKMVRCQLTCLTSRDDPEALQHHAIARALRHEISSSRIVCWCPVRKTHPNSKVRSPSHATFIKSIWTPCTTPCLRHPQCSSCAILVLSRCVLRAAASVHVHTLPTGPSHHPSQHAGGHTALHGPGDCPGHTRRLRPQKGGTLTLICQH